MGRQRLANLTFALAFSLNKPISFGAMFKRSELIRLLILMMILGSMALSACNSTKQAGKSPAKPSLEHFATLLNGTFTSEKQASTDTNYFPISLVMTRIWEDRKDGIWLYVEQAMMSRLNKPYRQRVYRLDNPSQGIFTSDIYTFSNPLELAGLQNDAAKRNQLTPERITLKNGCTVIMRYENGQYVGGTDGSKCPSDLRGAKYTTTKISLQEGRLDSWDQGFDSTGTQVWGATGGGYIFLKK